MSVASTAFATAAALLPSLVLGQHGEDGEHGEVEHFKVFHVEWPRVEVPYVVFVWILTTTFVKLGDLSGPFIGQNSYYVSVTNISRPELLVRQVFKRLPASRTTSPSRAS